MFKAGDIILFSGSGFISWFIKAGTWSKYSHVGIMLDETNLAESTSLDNINDVVYGKNINGVMIVNICERVVSYKGNIYIKSLKDKMNEELRLNMIDRFKSLHGRPYEESILELLKSGIDWLPSTRADLSSVFCSELVSVLLEAGGIHYDKNRKHNDYSPKNISNIAGYNKITKIK